MITDPQIAGFITGALTAGYLVAALFFLKFWRRTRDRLFATFAAAFVLMAINQAAPLAFNIADERVAAVYLLRLAAFVLIIAAVLAKNLKRRR
jgi:membrane-associated PAP2 superfamily phosphatase